MYVELMYIFFKDLIDNLLLSMNGVLYSVIYILFANLHPDDVYKMGESLQIKRVYDYI